MENTDYTSLIILIAALIGFWIILRFVPMGLYFTAKLTGAPLSIFDLIQMKFKKIPAPIIVRALITSHKGGLHLSKDDLEALYLAGGDCENAVHGVIFAKNNGIDLTFKEASQLSLARKDVIDEIKKRIANT